MEQLMVLTLEPLRIVGARFGAILPKLLAMTVIMICGLVTAGLVRSGAGLLLTVAGFDGWSDRAGFTALLRKADIWSRPSQAAAAFLSWILLLAALLAALTAFNASLVDDMLARALDYLPRVLSAVLILVLGSLAAGLVSRGILISLVNSGFGSARHYARAVRVLLFVILIAMSLEQLMIAPGIVLAAFSIVFGGVVLAVAIACGIAGVDVIKKMFDRQHADESEAGPA